MRTETYNPFHGGAPETLPGPFAAAPPGGVSTWDYNRCISVLKREVSLLNQIAASQETIRKAVMAREWTDYDEEMAALNRLSDEFEAMEAERIALFRCMGADHFPGKDHVPSFYSLAARLPEGERRELSAMYRALKLETLKIRAANSSFLQYLNEAKAMTAAFLEAAFPDRYGRIYSRRGKEVMSHQPRSMVLNHQI